jgi:proline iminopeptidase
MVALPLSARDPMNTCQRMLIFPVLVLAGFKASADASTPPARSSARQAIADSQRVTPGGIQELKAIEINGIKQWISIRGNDPRNPILLFLHGGPGSPMMAESWTFQRPWEDFFTVVQWDQRGAGKTFTQSGRKVDASMTVDEMQADAEAVIDWLRHTYGKERIFLLGHSWGSVLGVKVAQRHPDWLYAYIAVGQAVGMRQNESVGYQQTLEKARQVNNTQAVKELEAIAPYPNDSGPTPMSKLVTERKWDVALGGMLYGHQTDNEAQRWSMSPDYSEADVKSAELGEASSVGVLWSQLATVDFAGVSKFDCPVFMFAGADDRTTPQTLAKEFFDRIQAPQKKFYKIDGAAHYVFNERPGIFLLDLVRDVRPLAESHP